MPGMPGGLAIAINVGDKPSIYIQEPHESARQFQRISACPVTSDIMSP